MQKVVVVVGGGFVVVVVGVGFVVVVVGVGFVVVVVGVGFVVVVVTTGFVVVVVVVGGFVVVVVGDGLVVVGVDEGPVVVGADEEVVVVVTFEGFEVVVDGECVAAGEVVEVAVDAVDDVVDKRVVVVPETTGDADGGEGTVVVGSELSLGRRSACEFDATTETGWACIKDCPPAAVVPSATEPATRAT
jgi:hypothetical protein